MFRALLDLGLDSICRIDRDLRYVYANDRVALVSGIPVEDWIGRPLEDVDFDPDDVEVRGTRIRRVFTTGQPSVHEDEFTFPSGSIWHETQLLPELDDAGSVTHVVVVSRDITARKEAERRLTVAAERDPLTGLANRVALTAALDETITNDGEAGLITALLLVDLDRFKVVNDSLGHAVGDELLRRAAERLESILPDGSLVCRHGGDEFVVLMGGLDDPARAVEAAVAVVEAFRRPLVHGTDELSTTASIGISATATARGRVTGTDLLREADTAMYSAKEAGRDGISVFDQEQREVADERLRIENELRGASPRGEIAVWYQPEVDVRTGRIQAVEALMRWHHPSGEIYPAGRFINIAAESGLIVELGGWVLGQAIAQAAAWQRHALMVRVNLAPRQLETASLLPLVDRALQSSGTDPGCLCMEITEMALLRDTPLVNENLHGLTDRGISIALDDFGTGYASLTYLRRFHIDVIKIDRSFVTDIAVNRRDQDLTAAVVALAHQLDITVTAEGVETPEQAAIVERLGCDGAQGFLFGQAVPASELEERLVGPGR